MLEVETAGHAPAGDAQAVVVLDGVGLSIGGARILQDVSMEIRPGEFIGLIGPNGAGKTTLVNAISGTLLPTEGTIYVHGDDITQWPSYRRSREAAIGRTFQTSNLLLGLRVVDNVRLAAQRREGGLLSNLRRVKRHEATVETALEALERVGLRDRAVAEAGSLSHGDRRKLELAILIATDAKVLLLDEPMAGVNLEDVEDLVELIREVQVETQATVLMVEHHMHVVTALSDRLAVMHHGSLLAFDEPDAVMANETVQTAYLGDDL